MSIASEIQRLQNAKEQLIKTCNSISNRTKWIPNIEGGQINDVIDDIIKASGHGECSYYINDSAYSNDIFVDKLSLDNDEGIFRETIDDLIANSPTYVSTGNIISWRGRNCQLYQLVDDGEGHDCESPEADNYCYMILENYGDTAFSVWQNTQDRCEILKHTRRALILTRDLELYR